MEQELPLGFGMALAQRPEALNKFAKLSAAEKEDILRRAGEVTSRGEMQALVQSLAPSGQDAVL